MPRNSMCGQFRRLDRVSKAVDRRGERLKAWLVLDQDAEAGTYTTDGGSKVYVASDLPELERSFRLIIVEHSSGPEPVND